MACFLARSTAPWLAAALLLGCRDAGADPDPQPSSSSSSSGVDTTTTGTAASTSEDGETGTGSSTGGADESSTGDAPGPVCETAQLNMIGTLAGAPIDASFDPPFGAYVFSPTVVFDYGWFGALVVHDVEDPATQTPAPVTGMLRLPDDLAAAPGTWFCIGEGSTYVGDAAGATHLQLVGLAELGVCPGTPIDGGVEVCLGSVDCEVARITGTIGDATFEVSFPDYAFGFDADTAEAAASFAFGDGGGWSVVHTAAFELDNPASQAAVDWAYFTVPQGLPDAGAVYCGTGTMRTNAGDPESIELTSLSRVGTCADLLGDGVLEVCAQ